MEQENISKGCYKEANKEQKKMLKCTQLSQIALLFKEVVQHFGNCAYSLSFGELDGRGAISLV